jgi:ubiquinone/menaquinone biosynthesis C-methylase UbiE
MSLSKIEEWEYDYKESPEKIDNCESDYYEEIKRLSGSTLDVGCGTLKSFLDVENDGYSVALDFSKEGLKIAKENINKKGKKQQIDLVRACAEFLPFKNESFNTVICIETLKHAEDTYRKVLDELKRVSKRKLIFTTDHRDKLYQLYRVYGSKFTIRDNVFTFHDTRYRTVAFDEKSIERFLKEMNLKIVKLAIDVKDYNEDYRVIREFGHLPLKKSKTSIYVECEKKTS